MKLYLKFRTFADPPRALHPPQRQAATQEVFDATESSCDPERMNWILFAYIRGEQGLGRLDHAAVLKLLE